MSFIAACLQMNSSEDVAANIAQAEKLLHEALAKNAQLIALPENCFSMRREGMAGGGIYHTESHPGILWAINTAAQHKIHILIGSIRAEVAGRDLPLNRSVLIGPAGILASYDKLHLFDVTLPDGTEYRESARAGYGEAAILAQTPLAAIGMTICYDVRFAALYHALAQAGAQIFTVPSAFTRPTGAAHWEVLLRARAIENGAFVLAPAQCGEHPGGRTTYGHSLIIDPWGKILAAADGDHPGVICAEMDVKKVAAARAQIPVLRHSRADIKVTIL
jgi:predicted amidohydrolase